MCGEVVVGKKIPYIVVSFFLFLSEAYFGVTAFIRRFYKIPVNVKK